MEKESWILSHMFFWTMINFPNHDEIAPYQKYRLGLTTPRDHKILRFDSSPSAFYFSLPRHLRLSRPDHVLAAQRLHASSSDPASTLKYLAEYRYPVKGMSRTSSATTSSSTTISGGAKKVRGLDFSQDARHVLFTTGDGVVRIYDVERPDAATKTFDMITTKKDPSYCLTSACFDLHQPHCVEMVSAKGKFVMWDLRAKGQMHDVDLTKMLNGDNSMSKLHVNPAGSPNGGQQWAVQLDSERVGEGEGAGRSCGPG